ncbi:MAG: CAP domain-containing protein [Alphaproteobacteria bacterium]
MMRRIALAFVVFGYLFTPAQGLPAAEPEAALLAAVNVERAVAGLRPLASERRLACAAEAHARDLAGGARFGHTGSDGGDLAKRLGRVGYAFRTAAENLAAAGASAAEVVALWRASPGHARNMLRRDAHEAGAARARARDGRYIWVLVVATKGVEPPENTNILTNCAAFSG